MHENGVSPNANLLGYFLLGEGVYVTEMFAGVISTLDFCKYMEILRLLHGAQQMLPYFMYRRW